MKEKISKLCKRIEKECKIKILFAVENGSRAWRMESKNSDYDVRFVYVRPLKEYLKISRPYEIINRHYNKDSEPMKQQGCYFDICGFDVFKFVRMLTSSNPTTVEWLQTDILYCGARPRELKQWANEKFNPIKLYYHYKSLARSNYNKYIESNKDITYKRYLYCMRGVLNSEFVKNTNKIPPISFLDMLQYAPKDIKKIVEEIIINKKSGKEKEKINRLLALDNYILECINKEEPPKSIKSETKELDVFLQELLKK